MRQILVALFLVASNAHAESWLQIADLNPKGGLLVVDTAHVDRVSNLRRTWFKAVYSTDRPIGDSYRRLTPVVQSYRWELSFARFNCAEMTVAVTHTTLYAADEQVVGSFDAGEQGVVIRDMTPGSVGWLLLQAVCASSPDGSPPKPLARLTRLANPDDFYPSASRSRGEQGSPVVKVCVGSAGEQLREPEITDTSGFPDLDAAAIKVAKANRYAAAIENGAPSAESCIKFKVKFVRFN